MNRNDFQQLSRFRLREASALLRSEHYIGAYYLAGCAVECALKACIAKQTRRHDYPDDQLTLSAWTHSLEGLVKAAGLWGDLQRTAQTDDTFAVNWAVTKDWTAVRKYDLTTDRLLARDLYSAVSSRKYGVLPWIRQRW